MFLFKSKPKPAPEEPFVAWSSADFSVGVARFDQDHKRLADLLNRIHAALIQNRDRAQASQLMDELIQETRFHFFQEEAALKAASYPGLEAHAAEHQALLQEAADLHRQFQAGTISGLAFPNFLKNWFTTHIKESDRKYSAWLRRHGER
ncbi:MAG: hemerythrin family protein [Holophaga sp.]|nr:hemerythrin family protein [Holophaga sp.]